MKIVSSGKGIHSPEFYKKKLKHIRIKRVLWILLALMVIAAPIYLLRMKRFLISDIRVEGNQVTKHEEIESLLNELMADNYLWIFPKSNILLSPKKQMTQNLLDRIPRLMSVSIGREGSHSLVVSVAERQPDALYCVSTDCFFMDESGYIFSEAPDFSGGVYTTYVMEPALDLPLRKRIMSEERFRDLKPFIAALADLDIRPERFVIRDDEYHLELPSGGEVIMKAGADLDLSLSNLESFLTSSNISKEQNFLDRVLYIDMRFGNKIFYKFR
jgi:hypothetical protein